MNNLAQWPKVQTGQSDCPGNKVRSHREQSAGSSRPSRCPRECCTLSCATAHARVLRRNLDRR
jgi:hypothetical protein